MAIIHGIIDVSDYNLKYVIQVLNNDENIPRESRAHNHHVYSNDHHKKDFTEYDFSDVYREATIPPKAKNLR